MTDILEAFSANPWFGVVTSVVTLFSAIAAVTPTPKQGSLLAKVYSLVDWAALNVGKAKDTGE